MKIVFWGDILPGGILPYLKTDPLSESVKQIIGDNEIGVGTLECAIGDNLPFDSEKMKGRANIIYAPTSTANLLVQMGIKIVSLANNHIFDLGKEGLISTINFLKQNGILYTGAGENIDEAVKPVIIEREGIKIAFIAGCTYDSKQVAYVPIASNDHYGIVPLESEEILLKIKECKKTCDYVVLLAHWGKEYSHFPLESSKKLAQLFINSGVDLIIGGHTHTAQPECNINGKKVFFSLGNGLFPDFLMNKPRPIWYPDPTTFDIGSIPSTLAYPYPVDRPLLRVWPTYSRIGILAECKISKNKIYCKRRFVRLSNENVIEICRDTNLHIWLKIISIFIKTPLYDEGRFITRVRNGLSKVKHFFCN